VHYLNHLEGRYIGKVGFSKWISDISGDLQSHLFEIQNKTMKAIFLWAYENIRNVLSSWVCGFLNDRPFKKTFNLLINDLYLQWIEIVLAGYKKLSGLLIKVNCDPSNSTEDPLIWDNGLPFGK